MDVGKHCYIDDELLFCPGKFSRPCKFTTGFMYVFQIEENNKTKKLNLLTKVIITKMK